MEEAQIVLRTELIVPEGVSTEYGIPIATQRDLRRRGDFPPVMKIGRRVYVRRSQLESWLDDHIQPQPTDQRAEAAAGALGGARSPAKVEQQEEFAAAADVMP